MHTSPLPPGFFAQTAGTVARNLVGKTIVSRAGATTVTAIIVEAEAFEDGASGGVIRDGMLYAPETLFVMSHRGHVYLNVATDARGKASCVMVRSILVGTELVDGPGKVSKRLEVTGALDGRPLGTEVEILANKLATPMTKRAAGAAKNSTARHAADPRWVVHQQAIASSAAP